MAYTNNNDELARFKMMDPRPTLLSAMGWMHQPKDSDDKRYVRGTESIHVFQGSDGTWLARSGTEYRNFVQIAKDLNGGNLGQTRKFLRSILGTEAPVSATPSHSLPPASADFSSRPPISHPSLPSPTQADAPAEPKEPRTLAEIKAEIAAESVDFADKPIPGYLLERGFMSIPPVFRRAMRITKDRLKNVCFLFYLPTDDGGVELVSREKIGAQHFKNYLSRTRAGVWIASPKDVEIDHIVIGESPLDCISSREICGDGDATAYFGVRMGAEDACVELVCRLITKRGQNARIEIRTDNDTSGFIYAAKLSAGFGKRKPEDFGNRKLVARYTSPPDSLKDWTEVQEARFAEHQKSA